MRRLEFLSDCASCAGLCCELTAFEVSEDFACDKPAGERCPHLSASSRCGIHTERAQHGFRGCELYECFGSGPRATSLFQTEPLAVRIEGFRILRALAELAWLLHEAQALCTERMVELRCELARELDRVQAVGSGSAHGVLACDVGALEAHGHALLQRVGAALGGREGSGCASERRR
jgi:hypothetical protein